MKDNFVIEVFDKKHGHKVKEYFRGMGVDVSAHNFCGTGRFRYYGLIEGKFDNYSFSDVEKSNAEVIELPVQTEGYKSLQSQIRRLALSQNKLVKSIELIELPDTNWCLVWDTGSLKPYIEPKDRSSRYSHVIDLPSETNKFINSNFY